MEIIINAEQADVKSIDVSSAEVQAGELSPVNVSLLEGEEANVNTNENQIVQIDLTELDVAPTEWNEIVNKPSTFPPSEHIHDDRYYTEPEVDSKIPDIQYLSNSDITDIWGN